MTVYCGKWSDDKREMEGSRKGERGCESWAVKEDEEVGTNSGEGIVRL